MVGVTCASYKTLEEGLDPANPIPIVLMDEASQLPETTSILPLVAARQATRLLMVGHSGFG